MTEDFILQNIVTPAIEKACISWPGSDISSTNPVVLYGADGAILDSLSLVGFIFALEEALTRVTGKECRFSADDILNTEARPFLNISNLIRFLQLTVLAGSSEA